MTHPTRTTPAMILACIWVLAIFVLFMIQFKPIILSLVGRVFS